MSEDKPQGDEPTKEEPPKRHATRVVGQTSGQGYSWLERERQQSRRRRRGRKPEYTEEQWLAICRGWLDVADQVSQEAFMENKDAGARSLRRWLKRFEEEGKL